MTDEVSGSLAPPYISFRTFLNLIDRLASGGIPQHIDRHYWKGFLSGSLGPQVMTALRFFMLITGTDNTPTPELGSLVEDKENRKRLFAEMLQRFYSPVFDDNDLARATMGDLDRTFTKHYKQSVDTRRKSISFFLHAVQYVEFPLSTYLKEASRTKSTVTRGTNHHSPTTRPPRQPQVIPERPVQTAPVEAPIVTIHRPNISSEYPLLEVLLQQLPTGTDKTWTQAQRDRWLKAVAANLDVLIVVEDEQQ